MHRGISSIHPPIHPNTQAPIISVCRVGISVNVTYLPYIPVLLTFIQFQRQPPSRVGRLELGTDGLTLVETMPVLTLPPSSYLLGEPSKCIRGGVEEGCIVGGVYILCACASLSAHSASATFLEAASLDHRTKVSCFVVRRPCAVRVVTPSHSQTSSASPSLLPRVILFVLPLHPRFSFLLPMAGHLFPDTPYAKGAQSCSLHAYLLHSVGGIVR